MLFYLLTLRLIACLQTLLATYDMNYLQDDA